MGAAKIGQIAQETGLSIDTIRFYEKQGLLKRSPRTEGGFRLFALSDIETLKFVRKAQELGFSLNEIRELLISSTDGRNELPYCSSPTGRYPCVSASMSARNSRSFNC